MNMKLSNLILFIVAPSFFFGCATDLIYDHPKIPQTNLQGLTGARLILRDKLLIKYGY